MLSQRGREIILGLKLSGKTLLLAWQSPWGTSWPSLPSKVPSMPPRSSSGAQGGTFSLPLGWTRHNLVSSPISWVDFAPVLKVAWCPTPSHLLRGPWPHVGGWLVSNPTCCTEPGPVLKEPLNCAWLVGLGCVCASGHSSVHPSSTLVALAGQTQLLCGFSDV